VRNVEELAQSIEAKEAVAAKAQVTQREKPPRNISQGVHQFLKRFKSYCDQLRFVAADIFSPYDIGHNGTIPVYNVQAALNNARFEVIRGEVEEVIRAFRDERRPELFNYADLVEALKYEDIKSPEVRASLASAPISAEMEREALTTCSQIREKLLARHRNIRQAFSGLTEQALPLSEFQARLARLDLVLRAGAVQSVVRKFRMNLTDSIDWNAFCTQVEQSKTI
jgi:Ca2+-binding EF-hand superfamily protein